MHIILGAGGVIGTALAAGLLKNRERVRLASRSGKLLPGTESVPVDLLSRDGVQACVEPGATAYLVVGLPYSTKLWQEQWPRIMRNAIDACAARKAKLVFLDNAYMYGKITGALTEETAINPCSRKGEVRAEVAEMFLAACRSGSLNGTIGRSSDFYGPYARQTSVFNMFVLDRLMRGKKAQVMVDPALRHSLTYTIDCAEALITLAGAGVANGSVWHVPTASPLTGNELVAIASRLLGRPPASSAVTKGLLRVGGFFSREAREVVEMLYQFEVDYVFDSSKFEKAFPNRPISYEEGIKATIEDLRQTR